ncbi:hypothetical protein TheetDRAFT_2922 [Thermoanaerobacter ethanolicus JW 200]|nr:hypothetical protein TheetDRAFT_2922 [Thermoanaerobacter ethanolicus JW 200]
MYQLQLLLNIPELFTSQSKIDFYSSMFENLDLSSYLNSLPLVLAVRVILTMHFLELLLS